MSPQQTNLLQGTLDLLILKSLNLGEMHGLGISRRIEQITRGTFRVKPGRCSRRCIGRSRPAFSGAVGSVRKQPQGEVLPADARWAPAPRYRNRRMAADRGRDDERAQGHVIVRIGPTEHDGITAVIIPGADAWACVLVFVSCFQTLTRGARLDAELDAELRAHVDLLTDERVRAGMPPGDGPSRCPARSRRCRAGEASACATCASARGWRRSPWTFSDTRAARLRRTPVGHRDGSRLPWRWGSV